MFAAAPSNNPASSVDVRFTFIGWNADESDANENEIQSHIEYIKAAVVAGLDPIEVAEDLAQAVSEFEHIDVGYSKHGDTTVVTVLAQVGGRGSRFDSGAGRAPAPVRGPSRFVA